MNHLNSAPMSTTDQQKLMTPNKNLPISSNTLFTDGDVVLIQHQENQYFLRRTRNGKLILTK